MERLALSINTALSSGKKFPGVRPRLPGQRQVVLDEKVDGLDVHAAGSVHFIDIKAQRLNDRRVARGRSAFQRPGDAHLIGVFGGRRPGHECGQRDDDYGQ
jgi:hypothetical protein